MPLQKTQSRYRRHQRSIGRMQGTADKPRLIIYRSNTSMYAQLIDDTTGKTLVSASSMKLKKGTPIEKAKEVGAELAKKARDIKITTCVFDRNGFKYHGRVKAVADSAREEGLNF
ncbi:50S ribosomal protein L18 [bacterium]|nr:50S ribosomal protein L18 [bacterium]